MDLAGSPPKAPNRLLLGAFTGVCSVVPNKPFVGLGVSWPGPANMLFVGFAAFCSWLPNKGFEGVSLGSSDFAAVCPRLPKMLVLVEGLAFGSGFPNPANAGFGSVSFFANKSMEDFAGLDSREVPNPLNGLDVVGFKPEKVVPVEAAA